MIQTRERRRPGARLEHLDGLARAPRVDAGRLKGELARHLEDWRALLGAEPAKDTFTGKASYGRLLAGVIGQNVWCPPDGPEAAYVRQLKPLLPAG